MASLLRFRTFIWEPNAYPGMTNRWLARVVTGVMVVFEDAARVLRSVSKSAVEVVGLPVRKVMVPAAAGAREERDLRLARGGPLHVLVFGGSQGARGINSVVIEALEKYPQFFANFEIVHQTGAADFANVTARAEKLGRANYKVTAYILDMDLAYHAADVVFCRAGASTIAELAACEKASVLIPLPSAADDHQRKNAVSLSEQGAARVVEQREFTPELWMKQLTEFVTQPNLITQLEQRIQSFHHHDPGQRISGLLLPD